MAQSSIMAKVVVAAAHNASSLSRDAVFWLEPVTPQLIKQLSWSQQTPYRLLQKNRMFSPHMLVVPVGATVMFRTLIRSFTMSFRFDGKRFDLGLYEAGSTKSVRFEREGISYIFCNIHPEMIAVVIALSSRLYSAHEGTGKFVIPDVPEGDYEAHFWVGGEEDHNLRKWTHRVSVGAQETIDAGTFLANPQVQGAHANKFGQRYKSQPPSY